MSRFAKIRLAKYMAYTVVIAMVPNKRSLHQASMSGLAPSTCILSNCCDDIYYGCLKLFWTNLEISRRSFGACAFTVPQFMKWKADTVKCWLMDQRTTFHKHYVTVVCKSWNIHFGESSHSQDRNMSQFTFSQTRELCKHAEMPSVTFLQYFVLFSFNENTSKYCRI